MSGPVKKIICFTKRLFGDRPQAVQTTPTYYVDDIPKRDLLLRDIYQGLEEGRAWLDAIRTPQAAKHGERFIEYTFLAALLKELQPASILDVGCVLNNAVIADIVSAQSQIYFLNPSLEDVLYREYGYFRYSLSAWKTDWTFPLVTCLSTLEHIGFDNTRYGVDEVDQGWGWPRCIEEVVRNIETLFSLTAPGGTMVASCPFGCKEFVLHPPGSGVRTAQVLHKEHVDALRRRFAGSLDIQTLRLSANGWEQSAPDADYEPYGAVGPGASGIILVIGKKGR
jgi:hypothetical protein